MSVFSNWVSIAESIGLNEVFNERTKVTKVRMGPTQFDAKKFRIKFIKKAIANAVRARDNPILVQGNRKSYLKCQIKEDLAMFLVLFSKYGNNIHKALKECKNSSLIEHKCYLYGIETGISHSGRRHGLKHDELSLSRIALAFPLNTATALLYQKSEGVLVFSTFFNQELPLLMQHIIFPGLIPAKQFTNDLKEIALVLNVEKSVRLSKCEDIDTICETLGEMIESSIKYIDAGINNDLDDEGKLKMLKESGILDVNSDGEYELSSATIELVNKLEGIKALYSLKYSDAVNKANMNNEDVNSD